MNDNKIAVALSTMREHAVVATSVARPTLISTQRCIPVWHG